MKVYRVEDPKEGHGLWRDFDGTHNPVFSKLTIGKCRNLPMDDSDFYRADNKCWFSSTDTPEKLREWFDALDVVQMQQLGYDVFEFEVNEWREVNQYETVFTRESIISVNEIDPSIIWDEYSVLVQGKA